MPKVSVIIPVYNVEKYLRRCLDSVCNQTLQDIEIICVNDCSPDNSLDILQEYAVKDSRIKIIDFKENKGAAVARNTALSISQGDYIGFVDSDDFIDLNYYEKLYEKAKLNNSDLVVGNIKEYKNEQLTVCPFIEQVKLNKHYFTGLFVLGLYSKKMLDKYSLNFIENITYGEDRFLPIASSIYANNFTVVDYVFYNYDRSSDSSVTMQKNLSDKNIKDFFKSTKDIFIFLNSLDLSDNVFNIYSTSFLTQVNDMILPLGKDAVVYKKNICDLYDTVSSKHSLNMIFKPLKELYIDGKFNLIKLEFNKQKQLKILRSRILKTKG